MLEVYLGLVTFLPDIKQYLHESMGFCVGGFNALFLQGKTNTFPDRQQLFMENDHIICLTNDRVT